MKNTAKLVVISVFALCALFLFLSSKDLSKTGAAGFSGVTTQPTPPKANSKTQSANSPSNTAANAAVNKVSPVTTATPAAAAPAATSSPATAVTPGIPTGAKAIPKTFTLGQDSLDSEWGEAAFNHDNHAYLNYSADGKSVLRCVECHHTDQPKAALIPPDVTSERNETLTFDVFQKSSQKVSTCRSCHFQPGSEPDGKTIPAVTFDWDKNGKNITKTLDNKIAYHINCNTCHDKAAALRSELKKKRDFATGNDCGRCHKPI